MPSAVSPQWQEKASSFFSTSGVKIKEAGHTAGTFVEEVTKDAKVNASDMAGRVGSMFKSRWAILQKPSTRQAVQERLITAAATTGTLFRKGFSETKDKVSVGKIKVEEVAKKTAQKSKTILSDIERWQKGVASTDVFGVPLEVTVQRQQSSRPIPHILVKCADYLVLSGLNTPYLFKHEGDKKVVQQLISIYNQDSNASLPEDLSSIDVAALIKCYLATLPEPLTTFELYNDIRGARSSINGMRNILKRLPAVNYTTLEFVTALLLRVSQKAVLNKMDSQTLAMEMAPVIIWQKGREPDLYKKYWSKPSEGHTKKNSDPESMYSAWDMLSDEDDTAGDSIPLDDGVQIDFGAIEVVQCLMEHHNAIFTDANETRFYLPYVMMGADLLLGNSLRPAVRGIIVGHLYYFLTVLYPLAGGRNMLKTPLWVHKLVAYWGEGEQMNAPVQRSPYAGVAFQGRRRRLNENTRRAATPEQQQPQTNAATQANAGGVSFQGRSHRLDRS